MQDLISSCSLPSFNTSTSALDRLDSRILSDLFLAMARAVPGLAFADPNNCCRRPFRVKPGRRLPTSWVTLGLALLWIWVIQPHLPDKEATLEAKLEAVAQGKIMLNTD